MTGALPPSSFGRHQRVPVVPGVVGRLSAGLVALVRAADTSHRAVLNIYRPGDIIGARALLSTEAPHADTYLEAMVPTGIDWLRGPETVDAALTRAVLGVTAARARYLEYAVWRRREQSIEQRVAQLLAGLSSDPVHGTDGCTSHRIRRADAALLAGTTKSTAGQIYQQFARRGWITIAGHTLSDIDVDALRGFAGRGLPPEAYPTEALRESEATLWDLLTTARVRPQ